MQLLSRMGFSRGVQKGCNALPVQTKSCQIKDLNTDVFLVTLNKSEKNYSPTTLYEDYAINRQGRAISNFDLRLPEPQSSLAKETLKDPYIFDFLTIEPVFHERELEAALVADVERFLLELGAGFAFMGRQYHFAVDTEDFYIDFLFYHTKLHCYVVVELKNDKFTPADAGQTNFYCSVVDGTLKQENDNPTIGHILCRSHNRVVAEYTLKNIDAAIGVSDYQLTQPPCWSGI